ncbi:hypothetical protein J6590_007563 [Homalodisca vitripennis]|nr:hypothetical protein J6590_007563 [Homalodisca vitripennis]
MVAVVTRVPPQSTSLCQFYGQFVSHYFISCDRRPSPITYGYSLFVCSLNVDLKSKLTNRFEMTAKVVVHSVLYIIKKSTNTYYRATAPLCVPCTILYRLPYQRHHTLGASCVYAEPDKKNGTGRNKTDWKPARLGDCGTESMEIGNDWFHELMAVF